MKTAPTFASRALRGVRLGSGARRVRTARTPWKPCAGSSQGPEAELRAQPRQTLTKAEAMGQKSDSTTPRRGLHLARQGCGLQRRRVDGSDDRALVFTSEGGTDRRVHARHVQGRETRRAARHTRPRLRGSDGHPFSMKMNPRGEVSDVQVPRKCLRPSKAPAPPRRPAANVQRERAEGADQPVDDHRRRRTPSPGLPVEYHRRASPSPAAR